MSAFTPHQRRLRLWSEVARAFGDTMTAEKWQIGRDIFATAVLGVLTWRAMMTGYPVTAALGTVGIGIVNTLTVAQLYRAFREVQAQNRADYTDDPEGAER